VDSNVTANSVHPGVIKTKLGRHLPSAQERAADYVFYDKDIPQGAATQCYVAANPIPAKISGHYFVDCNPATANAPMYDKDLAGKLWDVSEELIDKQLG
jgi:NAD(P)-dependent dehydrogenase (short-subunit alcohol dehydrogenase family)